MLFSCAAKETRHTAPCSRRAEKDGPGPPSPESESARLVPNRISLLLSWPPSPAHRPFVHGRIRRRDLGRVPLSSSCIGPSRIPAIPLRTAEAIRQVRAHRVRFLRGVAPPPGGARRFALRQIHRGC